MSSAPDKPRPVRVLIVDDDPDVCRVIREILAARLSDHELIETHTADDAMKAVEHDDPQIMLLDLHLGENVPDGYAVLERVRSQAPELPVVILSSTQDTDSIVRAMKAGAAHYLGKTPRYDELLERIELVLAERNRALRIQAHRLPGTAEIVGRSPAIAEQRELARRAASVDLPVLIVGETGTGKGLIAGCIHRWSDRSGPYREVNVAGLPASTLDSELFELVAGGTILLDEIGDLPRECQVKLLRVVEQKQFRRMGGERELTTDARILAATHAELEQMVAEKSFRADLYHRLTGLVIHVPPLRERKQDIADLARAFLGNEAELTDGALDRLLEHEWPGNVRELLQTLRRATVFAEDRRIEPEHIRLTSVGPGPTPTASATSELFELPYSEAREEVTNRFQAQYVKRLLAECDGNVSEASRRSGIARSHLHVLIKQLGLRE